MKYYKNAMGCKGDRIKIHFNGEGLIARNGKRVNTADGILMKLDGDAYIVFPYGRLHKGVKLEDLGKTSVRWNSKVDRWDINIASTRAQQSPIVTDRLSTQEKFDIKVVTKGHWLHREVYKAPATRIYNGIKPHAIDLAEVIKNNDELYTWLDNKFKEFVYNLEDRDYFLGPVVSSAFRFTIKAGKSKSLECVREIFDGDDCYAFIDDEAEVVKLIPAEAINETITFEGSKGYFITFKTAKELTNLMKKAKVFERSDDVIDSIREGLKDSSSSHGLVHIRNNNITEIFTWYRQIGHCVRHGKGEAEFILENIYNRI